MKESLKKMSYFELVARINNLKFALDMAEEVKRERDRDDNQNLYDEFKEAQIKWGLGK